MNTKEIIEVRWKLMIAGLLAFLIAGANGAAYEATQALTRASLQEIPPALRQILEARLGSYESFVWGQWFGNNGQTLLAIFAAIMASGLVANEVSKGTIFFLLSKPVSRERVLLTKYVINALALLIISLCGALAIYIASIFVGHTQDIGRLLIASGLAWLGSLFVLGLALIFSITMSDIIRPLILALLITVLLAIPGFVPQSQDWSLVHYWSSRDVYINGGLPLKEYGISLMAALVPLLASLYLFRRKAF